MPETPRPYTSLNNLRASSSHKETARRLRDLANHLRQNPEEAKHFREKTGIYDKDGQLTEAYR